MKEEYIIINKTKALELLKITEAQLNVEPDNQMQSYFKGIMFGLNQFLSQSTPLIPEIEKAFDAGEKRGYEIPSFQMRGMHVNTENPTVEDYISNLKLDI